MRASFVHAALTKNAVGKHNLELVMLYCSRTRRGRQATRCCCSVVFLALVDSTDFGKFGKQCTVNSCMLCSSNRNSTAASVPNFTIKAHKLWDLAADVPDQFSAWKQCESTEYFGAFATTMIHNAYQFKVLFHPSTSAWPKF